MANIKLLSKDIIEKISAGEVIERPASVVKELIENSIDAKSNKIVISVEDGGKKLIKVMDNGVGMSKDDLLLCTKRYATSKINEEEDLYNITTLGFRGEALASISAVSYMRIISRTKDDKFGHEIIVDAGEIKSIKEATSNIGTTVEVHNLFYNVPARKKFLQIAVKEFDYIYDVVVSYALAYPNIGFVLNHNNKNIIRTASSDDIMKRLHKLFGKNIVENLLSVTIDKQEQYNFLCKCYVTTPKVVRRDKKYSFLFINKRWVKNTELMDIVYEAYRGILKTNYFPFVLLFIDIDTRYVDVNVHPTKRIVKISILETIKSVLYEELRKQLRLLIAPLPDSSVKDKKSMLIKHINYKIEPEEIKIKQSRQIELSDYAHALDLYTKQSEQSGQYWPSLHPAEKSVDYAKAHTKTADEKFVLINLLKDSEYLGQLDVYLLFKTNYGLLIIDFHAADERINYEKLVQEFNENKFIEGQNLLEPIIIDLPRHEIELLLSNKPLLSKLGFDIDEFGDNSVAIRKLPIIKKPYYKNISKVDCASLIDDIVKILKESLDKKYENSKGLEAAKDHFDMAKFNISKKGMLGIDDSGTIMTKLDINEKIMLKACRMSIKKGFKMSLQHVKVLISELVKCEFPYSCPHGRNTFVLVTLDELEKRFKRKL